MELQELRRVDANQQQEIYSPRNSMMLKNSSGNITGCETDVGVKTLEQIQIGAVILETRYQSAQVLAKHFSGPLEQPDQGANLLALK